MPLPIRRFSWIGFPLLLAALTTLALFLDTKAGTEAVRGFAEEQQHLHHGFVYEITEAIVVGGNSIRALAHPEVARGPDELRAAMAAIYSHSQLHGSSKFLHIVFYDDSGDALIVFPRWSAQPNAKEPDEGYASGTLDNAEPDGAGVSKPFVMDDGYVVALSVPVHNQALVGRVVGFLNLSQVFAGYLAKIAQEGTPRYVLDERGAIVVGPFSSPGGHIADYLDQTDSRSTLLHLFLWKGYRSFVRFKGTPPVSLGEGENTESAVNKTSYREMVGLLHPFELGGNRFSIMSVRDWDCVIAGARAVKRRYWLAFGGFFIFLVTGGVLYRRNSLRRLARERGERKPLARELEARELKSIREINQALLEEPELDKLLDLLVGNISEALDLAGLQVITLEEGRGHRLVTAYFDERGEKGAADLGKDSPKRRNPIIPDESMDELIADVLERAEETGHPLRISPDTCSVGKYQKIWQNALKMVKRLGGVEFILCPLNSKDRTEGLAVFLPRQGGIPLELYETYANNLAHAIGVSRSTEQQRKTLDELDQAYGRLQAFSRIGAEIVVQKNFLSIGQRIVDAITTYSNFSRSVLSLVEGDQMRRIAFGNLTEKQIQQLMSRKPLTLAGLERIKQNAQPISRSYYLPAPQAARTIGDQGIASSHSPEEFINWDPDDFFFVPLEGLDGDLLGVISVDDPKDGLAPTEATIQPLESFAHLAAQAITTSRLRWELERSQNDYRNLFKDATDALFVLDEELKVVASNDQFSLLVGKPSSEVVGTSFVELAAPDWQAALKRAFERVSSGLGRQELEFHLQARGPSECIAAMSVEAKAFPGLPSILDEPARELPEAMDPKIAESLASKGSYLRYQGSLRDITGAKTAEREILRRAEQLKIINTLGRLALKSFDLVPLFDQTAEAIERSLGYDNVAIFMVDEGADELVMEAQSGIFDVLVGKGYRVKKSKGVVGWTARSGVTRYVPVAGEDPHFIMPAGIFEIGSELAIPLLVEGEVKGVLDLETMETNAFDPADISALETIADQLSQAIHNIKLYQELRERALALALANEELLKVDKMKSDFVSMVSHELNTPVTVIKGYAQLMAGSIIGEINEKQQDILETIIEKSDHLSHLIIELLDLLKIETGQYIPELQTTNLTKVLEELFVEQAKYIDTPRMSLVLELPKRPIILDVDLPKIRTVFIHLLFNATKFTIGEGTVTIEALEQEYGYQFTVADTGIGIPEVEYERIFERLYQVDSTLTRHYGGTGLGLAVTRAIVERHQGRIWVESELGEGSRFIFTLPKEIEQV